MQNNYIVIYFLTFYTNFIFNFLCKFQRTKGRNLQDTKICLATKMSNQKCPLEHNIVIPSQPVFAFTP